MAVLSPRPSGRRRPFGRRTPGDLTPGGGPPDGGGTPPRRRRHLVAYAVAGLVVLVLAALAVAALTLRAAHGRLSADPAALARVSVPLGGGQIQSAEVFTGPHSRPVAVAVRDGRLWPQGRIPAGTSLAIQVTIQRPGWLAWLTGAREHLDLTLTTPTAHLGAQYVTLAGRAPLTLHFGAPVAAVSYGSNPGHLRPLDLGGPQTTVTLPHAGAAGSMWVAAAPRAWETATPTQVSWFPAGARASAVASPAPGTAVSPTTPIRLTFSKPVDEALGHARPPVLPLTPGVWHQTSSHTIVFEPEAGGYGLGAHVTVALPAGVDLVGVPPSSAGVVAGWHVPAGSPLRLQQLLAQLGYLPLNFQPDGAPTGNSTAAQEQAAIHPPAGRFSWRYPDVPAALHSQWAPGRSGEMTRGAVMAFENDHGLATDGDPGPMVWTALIKAAAANQRSSFGYTFVDVNVSGQRLSLWHDGHTAVTTAVNTGAAGTPTQPGTFAVYEHLRVTTMSGTNPDGSHYHDPGIQFVSYFNGGDALHAFTRAQYGFPQSLGCVEMPLGPAGRVWPLTPIGTLVHVA